MPTCISWHSSLSHLGHAIGLSHASETCQSLPVVSSICFGEESVVLPGQPSGSILSPHCLRSLLWWAYKMASFQDFWLIGRSCRIFCGWVEDTLLQIGFPESSTCKSFLKTSPPPFGWRSSTSSSSLRNNLGLSQVWDWQTVAQPHCGPLSLAAVLEKLVFIFPGQALSHFLLLGICSFDVIIIQNHLASFQEGEGIYYSQASHLSRKRRCNK